jgi:protein TonB
MDLDDAAVHFSPRKLAGIAFVALLHLALIYALINGLGEQAVQIFQHPLEVKIIQTIKPPQLAPPPPPPPMVAPPPPFIPPPLVQITQPPPVPVIATFTQVKPVAPLPAPRPAPAPVRSAPVFDPNQTCRASVTLQNDLGQDEDADPNMLTPGATILQFLVAADGHVERAIVAGSSGHSDLDQEAQQALGQCTFSPAVGADGKPQETWTSIRYVWQLN